MAAVLQVKNISKKFPHANGDILALDKVDLYVDRGELVSIIGPSGCGKTTLLECVAGLTGVDDGLITINGKSAKQGAPIIGYLSQDDDLLPWLTLAENVALPHRLAKKNMAESNNIVKNIVGTFGLNGFQNHLPSSLSGGMRQRAALARTYLTAANLLLLDEPFGKLDALTRLEMQEWFISVWEKERKTILMVTHDIDEAILLSSRVYVLAKRPGKIALEIKVDLPRPRRLAEFTSPQFTALKKQLLDALNITAK